MIVGCLWIFFSDQLLSSWLHYPARTMTQFQTFKGWIYVIATAIMLYGLINREIRANQQSTQKLKNTLAELQAIEAALRDSEERFRAFMDNSPAASWITDVEGQIEYVSQTYLQLFQGPNNPVGQSLFDLYPPHIAQTYIDNIQSVARSRQVLETIEPGIRRTDGCSGQFLVYRFPLTQPNGRIQVGGVAIDITDRNLIEAALKRSESRFQQIAAAAPGVLFTWIFNPEKGAHYEYLNPYFEHVHEISVAEAMDNYWLVVEQMHPDDRELYLQAVAHGLENPQPFHHEWRMTTKSGKHKWLYVSAEPELRENGEMAWHGVCLDLTERKQAEELLRLKEQQFRQAIVNAPYPIMIHAEDGEVVQINQVWTELTGYEAADIPTIADWTEKAYGQRMETIRAVIDQLYALNERSYEGEFTPRTKDGQQRIWEFSSAPVGKLPDGRRLVLSMAVDITDRKQAEMQLRSALAEKEVLLKEIHHRVKNNLQIVSGLLQLQAQGLENPQLINALKESQNRVEAMSLIHKKLYAASDLEQIDVADYIQSLAVSLLTTYQISPGKIALGVEVEPVTLSLDQAIPCGLIINELVSNALKYAFPNHHSGEINIKLCHVNRDLKLTIQDNGVGLPQGLDWRNAQSLGLSLVYALVTEQLEGRLFVDHEQGTQFTIRFPHVLPSK